MHTSNVILMTTIVMTDPSLDSLIDTSRAHVDILLMYRETNFSYCVAPELFMNQNHKDVARSVYCFVLGTFIHCTHPIM